MKHTKDNIALFGKRATQALLAADGLAPRANVSAQLGNVDFANAAESIKALQNMPTRGNAFKMQEQPTHEQPASLTF